MRAIEELRRPRGSRTVVAVVAASVMLMAAFGSAVLAGNTSKQVYFGSGPTGSGVFPAGTSFNYDANYSLRYTPANDGGVTSVFVTIQNKGGGTLNHVVIQGGDQAPDPTANANYIPDGSNGSPPICGPTSCIPSLPLGLTYVAAYPAGACTIYDSDGLPAASGTGIECTVGQLINNASVTFRFAIQVPAFAPSPASNTYDTWFTASGNEGTSNQGSNQDAFFALGTVHVGQATACSNANFFTSGSFDGFGAPNCDQPATLKAGTFVSGAFAQVGVVTDDSLCPSGYKCFGKVVTANVEFGAPVPGGLQWTVLWQKSSLNGTPKGFIHFLDAYPTDPSAYEIVNFKTTAQCPSTIVATTELPCLNGKPGFVTLNGISYFRAVFTTATNYAGRGY